MAIGTLVLSCADSAKKTQNATSENSSKAKTNIEKIDPFKKRQEELKRMEPISFESLKSWLPSTLGGLPLKSAKSLFPMFEGQAEVRGVYGEPGMKENISLILMDAAGPHGDSFSNQIQEFKKEIPDKEVDGIQMKSALKVKNWFVRQDYNSNVDQTHISFFHDERVMIKLVASNFNVEESWDLIGELDFRKLSELAK